MPINALSPWVHPQKINQFFPSYTKSSTSYTPYIGKSKIFRPKQAAVMVTRARKEVPPNIQGPSESWP